MDFGEVSADQIEHPNETRSVSSPLKRKRPSASNWFQTKRANTETSPGHSSKPHLQVLARAKEHTETGGMASTYRPLEGDPPAMSPNRDSSRNSNTRDGRTRSVERGGPVPSSRRDITDGRSTKQYDDQRERDQRERDLRAREAEEYRKSIGRWPPTGPKKLRAASSDAVTSSSLPVREGVSGATNTPAQLSAALARFVSDVTQQVSLQVRRDAAKKTLDRATAEFEKGRQHHANFKSIEEVQRASLDKAHREFDVLEQELQEKRGSSAILIGDLVSCIASNSGATGSTVIARTESKLEELDIMVEKCKADWTAVRTQQGQFDKEWRRSQFGILNDVTSANERILSLTTKLEEAKDKDIAELRKIVDKLSSRAGEFPSRIIQMSKEISDMKDRSNEIKTLEKTLSEQLREISELRVQIHGDLEDPENNGLKRAVSNIEEDQQRFRQALSTLEKLMADFSKQQKSATEPRFQIIEDRLTTLEGNQGKAVTALGGPSSAVLEGIQNAQVNLIVRVDGLQNSQDAADEVMGSEIENLKTKSQEFEKGLRSLREQHVQELSRVSSKMDGLKADIGAAQATATAAVTNSNAGVINTNLAEDNKALRERIEGAIMGLANLDNRMNNITTEHLARQILGQLDEHTRGAESRLMKLDTRVNSLEERSQALPTVISQSIRMEIDALSSSLQAVQGDLSTSKTEFADHLKTLKDQVDKVEEYFGTLSGAIQQPQKPVKGDGLTPLVTPAVNDPSRKRELSQSKANGQKKRRLGSSVFDYSDSDSDDNDQQPLGIEGDNNGE